MVRAIDADKAIEVAQIKYNDWNLAMAAADGQREINLCFKKQELFKAVKAVLECVPTLTQPNEPLTCDGCDMQGKEVKPCASCIRDPRVCDYYTRRPPEGEA